MGDFSLVKDQRGVFRGIWLRNPDEANDLYFLIMLTARIADEQGQSFPEEYIASVTAKQYLVVRNTYNDDGGCFVTFGGALAPGE